METLYEILGVPENVSAEDVKKAYRLQAMKWHPDRNPQNKEQAEARFKQIGYAYKTLSNPASRADYDAELARLRQEAEARRQSGDKTTQEKQRQSQQEGFSEEDASSLFFEQMLDLAFELASRGYARALIVKALMGLDCPEAVARSVAAIAVERFQSKDAKNERAKEGRTGGTSANQGQAKASGAKEARKAQQAPASEEISEEEARWRELEPYFRAALVGPDFEESDKESFTVLKIVRFVLLGSITALLISWILMDSSSANKEEIIGLIILAPFVSWGVLFGLFELSKPHRQLVRQARLKRYMPILKKLFLIDELSNESQKMFVFRSLYMKKLWKDSGCEILFPAPYFGYYGILWPLIALAVFYFTIDTIQLMFITESSLSNQEQLGIWRYTHYPVFFIVINMMAGEAFLRMLYGKIKSNIIKERKMQSKSESQIKEEIYSSCRPRLWMAYFVTIFFIIIVTMPRGSLFEEQAEQMDIAVKLENKTKESLFKAASEAVLKENTRGLNRVQIYTILVVAASKGSSEAEAFLAHLYDTDQAWIPRNEERMRYWLQRAADHGDLWSMEYLGHLFYTGEKGFIKDDFKAVKYWRESATKGGASAQVSMGWAYMNGLGGLPVDYAEAAEWNHKGATGGNREGFNNLGWLYENGKGVKRDLNLALSLYKKASELGSQEATERYRRLSSELLASQPARSEQVIESRRVEEAIIELVQRFPVLNEKSPQFNQQLVDRVLARQKQLIDQGISPSMALKSAAYEIVK